MTSVRVVCDDSVDALRFLADQSVDAIVTDPPYGLGFMGKKWDKLPPGVEWAGECLRVLKPGGYMLAFGGTRTWHRLAVAVEDAGFELRDTIAWLYGSGFPKGVDVSKAVAKTSRHDADHWVGWNTSLKPAFEPVIVGRKPLEGTVANNVLTYGTGGLNIDSCRIGLADTITTTNGRTNNIYGDLSYTGGSRWSSHKDGRWPANVVLDETQAAALDAQSGMLTSGKAAAKGHRRNPVPDNHQGVYGGGKGLWSTEQDAGSLYGDTGGASRFFYVAKAPRRERPSVNGVIHPTVKPLALMRHLVRLVTPPDGVVLDPFAGSGTTVEAAILERFNVMAVEREPDYLPLIQARVDRAMLAMIREDFS